MTLDRLTADQIRTCEQQLLARVPADMPIGNVTLRSQLSRLGWNESQYWDIRNHLMARGILVSGRGKGGSVRRVVPSPASPSDIPVAATEAATSAVTGGSASEPYIAERDLYAPMTGAIKNGWAKDFRLDSLVVEITAQQGSKMTGGKWTRPDITVASLRTFPYLPGRHFDVITFEVKPQDQINVTAVFEALGQRQAGCPV